MPAVWALAALAFCVPRVGAQAPVAEPGIVSEPPAKTDPSFADFRLHQLEDRARVSRNALIGLSAATAVGAAFLFPGLARQCTQFDRPDGSTDLNCTTAGKALVGVGLPLFWGGATGVLITGIMFGVRKGKIRRLEDWQRYQESRAVRWDPRTSRFVF